MNAEQQQKFEAAIIKDFFITCVAVFAIVGLFYIMIMCSIKVSDSHKIPATKKQPPTTQQQEEENQRKIDAYLLLMAG